ncbi:hypothetical protein, partial [Yersinia pestis]
SEDIKNRQLHNIVYSLDRYLTHSRIQPLRRQAKLHGRSNDLHQVSLHQFHLCEREQMFG